MLILEKGKKIHELNVQPKILEKEHKINPMRVEENR